MNCRNIFIKTYLTAPDTSFTSTLFHSVGPNQLFTEAGNDISASLIYQYDGQSCVLTTSCERRVTEGLISSKQCRKAPHVRRVLQGAACALCLTDSSGLIAAAAHSE